MKRKTYYKVVECINKNSIPIIVGFRRTGKTTILRQLEKELGLKSKYISFDSIFISPLTDIQLMGQIINYIENEQIELFLFDEVQVRTNGDILLKNLFDTYMFDKRIKIAVTGSSTLSFVNKDLGVNRMTKVPITTFDFDEYVEFSNCEKTYDNFEKFLGSGGFPDFVLNNTPGNEQGDEILKAIVYNDIASQFNIDVDNLMRLIHEISYLSNGEFNIERSSQNQKLSYRQIENYIDVLERTQIVKKVYRVDVDGKTQKYKKFKLYLNPHFYIWLHKKPFIEIDAIYKGHIIEAYGLFRESQNKSFFYDFYYLKTKDNKEIDFVSLKQDGKNVFEKLIEFKYSESLKNVDFLLLTTISSQERIVYGKGKTELRDGIRFINIIE